MTPAWVRRPRPGPRLVHVNATATGGGVAELLHGLVPAQAADGLNVGWAVIGGDDEFFAFTKTLHHLLHGRCENELPLTGGARYRTMLEPQARWLAAEIAPGDVVALHDPQTLGMAPLLRAAGATVVWHCHIGTDRPGAAGPAAVWREFAPELSTVDLVVAALAEYAPPGVTRMVCAPAIDSLSPKNVELDFAEVTELLDESGLTSHVNSPLAAVEQEQLLPRSARMVLQVSRWDPLKDMPGLLACLPALPPDVHLVLAGTNPEEIPDDPEGLAVLAETRRARDALTESVRRRVHLVRTSMTDSRRAALLINALQRRADVVVQKSLAEGFGLTVTEAMAKGRPVVAGDVGGLRRQIVHEETGLLVDPIDPGETAAAVNSLLHSLKKRLQIGAAAAQAVARDYLMTRLVADYRTFAAPMPGEVGVNR